MVLVKLTVVMMLTWQRKGRGYKLIFQSGSNKSHNTCHFYSRLQSGREHELPYVLKIDFIRYRCRRCEQLQSEGRLIQNKYLMVLPIVITAFVTKTVFTRVSTMLTRNFTNIQDLP